MIDGCVESTNTTYLLASTLRHCLQAIGIVIPVLSRGFTLDSVSTRLNDPSVQSRFQKEERHSVRRSDQSLANEIITRTVKFKVEKDTPSSRSRYPTRSYVICSFLIADRDVIASTRHFNRTGSFLHVNQSINSSTMKLTIFALLVS